MLCMGIPISAKLLASYPIHQLCKKALENKSMIVGYKAVETFSESAAAVIDAKDLYPEGSVQLNEVKVFDKYRWQEAFYYASAVATAGGSAMAGIFDRAIDSDIRKGIPRAEGVMYEDAKGLVGWVRNQQIIVGNRELLKKYGTLPLREEEENILKSDGDEVLYIAESGRLAGLLLVRYTANKRVADVLKRMESSDMSLLIRTTDVNITAEKVAHDFDISIKNIKILDQKNSNVIRDEMIGKEKSSPAFIATKGGVTPFGIAVSECIKTKRDITLSFAIEVVGAILKLLITAAIILFAGINQINAMTIFVLSLLWVAAVLAAPMITQKFLNKR